MDYFNFKEEFLYQFIDLMEKSKTLGALNLVMEGLPGESITMTFKDRYCPMVSIEELFLRSQYEMLPVRILASETLQEFQTARYPIEDGYGQESIVCRVPCSECKQIPDEAGRIGAAVYQTGRYVYLLSVPCERGK